MENQRPTSSDEEFSFREIEEMWDELAQLAHRVRRQRNQFGGSYRTSDVLLSAMRRLTADAAKRWEEGGDLTWENKAAFFAAATTAMHRAIVEHVRTKLRDKRGGNRKRLPFDDGLLLAREDPQLLLELNDCLEKLSQLKPAWAEVARSKIFTPVTNEELAVVLEVSDSTVDDRWQSAKAYLQKCLGE